MLRLNSDLILLAFPVVVAVASVADIADDLAHGSDAFHIGQELVLLVAALIVSAWLVRDRFLKQRQLVALRAELESVRLMPLPENGQLTNARKQLAEAIRDQFEAWSLTPSEREVGQLLLKGFSLKEIALLRGTVEKTIRQQASSVYHKAGVSGRHAFAAWFLEDLL